MNFLRKIKNTLITLRFSILSIFITLFVIAILTLITFNYIRYSETMLLFATELMQKTSNNLFNDLQTELTKVKDDNETAAGLIQQHILNPETQIAQTMEYIAEVNLQLVVVQQAYWCDEKGDCLNSLDEPDNTIKSDNIFNSAKPPYREFFYRNKQGVIYKKVKQTQFDYDPRTRPWYLQAKNAKKTIWTDVYPLKEQSHLAFTIASPVYTKDGSLRGVFGMDVRLDWLSAYMKKLKISKNSVIFVVNKRGELIGYPPVYEKEKKVLKLINIHAINNPWVSRSFDLFKQYKKPLFTFTFQGKKYLANYLSHSSDIAQNWIIGIVAPVDDFTGELKKASLIDFQIGLIILIIGLFLVSQFVTQVVRPIKKLVRETNKIKNFDLEHEERVQSRIKEVMLISDAIHSMASGLKSFRKYVPATLVRQLIETGEDVRIGGTKRSLVILFSDIKNFTTISENRDPSELLELMSVYFEELSQIIVSEMGTIDKYIGDSIMAFWGAPIPVDHPCHAAARAALRCHRKLKELNSLWKEQGKPVLITRMGIHTGDVVVGNVGSSERLNYTALGDAINVASRLEGLNKVYGTFIIVSEEVYQIIKDDFILRKIEYVAVKGKKQGGYIYELIEEKDKA